MAELVFRGPFEKRNNQPIRAKRKRSTLQNKKTAKKILRFVARTPRRARFSAFTHRTTQWKFRAHAWSSNTSRQGHPPGFRCRNFPGNIYESSQKCSAKRGRPNPESVRSVRGGRQAWASTAYLGVAWIRGSQSPAVEASSTSRTAPRSSTFRSRGRRREVLDHVLVASDCIVNTEGRPPTRCACNSAPGNLNLRTLPRTFSVDGADPGLSVVIPEGGGTFNCNRCDLADVREVEKCQCQRQK